MGKSSKQSRAAKVLRVPAAMLVSLLVCLSIESALIAKGLLSQTAMNAGSIACCLASGITGMVLGLSREGDRRLSLISAAAGAALLTAVGLAVREEASPSRVMIHALCLVLPCLLSVIAGRGRDRKGSRRKKRRYSAIR